MIFQQVWFPAVDSQQVVGRVVEIEKEHQARSREAKRPVKIVVPAMLHKVVTSDDYSVTELKDHNREEVCARFPGAWEHYVKLKGAPPAKPEELPEIKGTPIDQADWIAREKLAWLKLQGFSTVEQLAGMSDAQMQQLGAGARTWKKKASQYLSKPA